MVILIQIGWLPVHLVWACDLNAEVVNLTKWLISLALMLESLILAKYSFAYEVKKSTWQTEPQKESNKMD